MELRFIEADEEYQKCSRIRSALICRATSPSGTRVLLAPNEDGRVPLGTTDCIRALTLTLRFKNKFLVTVLPLALRDCWSPFSNKLTLQWSYVLLNLNTNVQSHKGGTDTVLRQVPVGREFY